MMWAKTIDNHTYIYWNGQPIYKRWDDQPKHPSILFNNIWPNEWVKKLKHNEVNKTDKAD